AERNVSISRPWGDIRGTLSTPAADSGTAVLIIAGSGPTDRNCNSSLNLRTDAFVHLARLFDSLGMASLRYDKRGIGASRCDEMNFDQLRLDDYIDDAAACVAWLHGEGFRRVIVAGHSEGSCIALAVAVGAPDEVDAVISLCGAGCTMDRTLQIQLARQLTAHDPGMLLDALRIISRIKAGEHVPAEEVPKPLRGLFNDTTQSFLHSAMEERLDPQRLIRRTTCPVLIVGGELDIQISASDAESLHAARPDARKVIVDRMAHTLKEASSADMAHQMTSVYINPSLPLSEGLRRAITEFANDIP
ncbi:MAG: alpha/beta hydrolase, partial [Alistipes sp.]|nr:alpha/beta hydrolase [Alistipes sp.]